MVKIKVQLDENNDVIAWCDSYGSEGIDVPISLKNQVYEDFKNSFELPNIRFQVVDNTLNKRVVRDEGLKELKVKEDVKEIDTNLK